MALREFLLPWDSQPQEAVGVDWGNPLTAALKSAVYAGSGAFYDAATGKVAALSGFTGTATSGFVLGENGRSLAFDGTNDYASFGSYPGTPVGGGFTIAARLKRANIVTNQRIVAIRKGGVSYQLSGDGSSRVGAYTAGSATGGTSPAVGVWATIFAEFNAAGAAVGVYVNDGALLNTSLGAGADATVDQYNIGAQDGANRFNNGEIISVFVWDRVLTAGERTSISANPWQLFSPRSIWVPVSAGGGSASTITAAAGASTASTLAASSTAASTPTAAAGAATASTVAASSTAASAITAAIGAATAGTLTGSAVVAGAMTAAAGVGVGGTLVGTGLTAGASAITPADGIATASTLTASSVAASAITPAAGVATGGTLVSAGSVSAASMTPAAGASTTATFAASAVAATVAVAAAGVSSAQTIAASTMAVAAINAAAGATTAATMASPAGALSNAEMRELYDWVKELHRIHGLTSGVDLVVTPTSRTAGAISQTIGEVGTTVTVTRA